MYEFHVLHFEIKFIGSQHVQDKTGTEIVGPIFVELKQNNNWIQSNLIKPGVNATVILLQEAKSDAF